MLHVCLFLCQLSFAQAETPGEFERLLLNRMQEGEERPLSEQLLPNRNGTPRGVEITPLTIPDPPARKPDAAAMVSTARLAHEVPKEAKKLFDQAAKLVKKLKYSEAAALLEKAVVIDPQFADAHNDLGAQYMALGRLEDGEQEFRKAVSLDSAFAVARTNLAVCEFLRGDLVSAESDAQRALSFAPSNRASLDLLKVIRAKRKE